MKGISTGTGSISAKLGPRRRRSPVPSRHGWKRRGIVYSRPATQLAKGSPVRCFSLPSLDVSHLVAAISGAAVALTAQQLLKVLQRESDEPEEETTDLEARLTEMEAAWKVDRERVKVLEDARGAAVKDVMTALGEKRDAEFALMESKEALHRLKASQDWTRENQEAIVEGALDVLPQEVKTQLDKEAVQKLKTWMRTAVIDRSVIDSSDDIDSWHSASIIEKLKTELENEKQSVRAMTIETTTIKEFARSELQSMTNHLIQGRDEADSIRQEATELKGEVTRLKLLMAESQAVIKDLQGQLSIAKRSIHSSDQSMQYAHEMRAEAAQMVEVIEDKAYEELQKALQKSQYAQCTAMKEVLEAARAKDREQKLKEHLEDAQKKIKEKSLEVRYLTELIQILSSKEAQEHAEDQTLKQYFPPEDAV